MDSIEIEINNQFARLKEPDSRTRAICSTLAKSKFKLSPGTLSIVFVEDALIKKLHESFLDDPTPTDVITFPADPSFNSAGEICISVDEAIKNAKSFGTTISHEITLYLIHGWLHLFGFDDTNEEAINAMRLAEKDALKLIDLKDFTPDYQIV